jgi:hypothetical protein
MQPRSRWQGRRVKRMVEDRGEKKYNKGVPSLGIGLQQQNLKNLTNLKFTWF